MENYAQIPQPGKAIIEPRPVSEMKEEWLSILARIPGDGLKGRFAPVNVLGTLMHNPRTLGPFLDYWVTSKLEMGLSVREQELVILRMGFLYNCNYVWKHHVPVGREFGVTEEELTALGSNPLPSLFSLREEALLKLTDLFTERRTLDDSGWSEYGSRLEKGEIVDLISLVSQYVLFALVNNVARVELEEPLLEIPGFQQSGIV